MHSSAIAFLLVLLPVIPFDMITHFEPPLGNLFEAYQQAVDDVVQWVATTALSTRSITIPFTISSRRGANKSFFDKLNGEGVALIPPLQKLEGKTGPHTKSTGQTDGIWEVDISYGTLGKLGKAIANTNKVDVDYNVLVVLKGIIHARKGFAT